MAGELSTGTTVIANLKIGGGPGTTSFAGFGGASGGGGPKAGGGSGATYGRLDLMSNQATMSMWTATSASGMTVGDLRILLQASGISLVYSSGKSLYDLGVSNTSAVQP